MTVRVETARLTLVPLDASHTDHMVAIHHEPVVAGWLFLESPPTREQQHARLVANEEMWRERGYGLFAAIEKATGMFVGRVGALLTPETGRIEIAWTMTTKVHGR